MTVVTIIGQEPQKEKKLKPIEFYTLIGGRGGAEKPGSKPSEWDNIELVCKNYRNGEYDLLFCYKKDRHGSSYSSQALYLGHFNDGVVK